MQQAAQTRKAGPHPPRTQTPNPLLFLFAEPALADYSTADRKMGKYVCGQVRAYIFDMPPTRRYGSKDNSSFGANALAHTVTHPREKYPSRKLLHVAIIYLCSMDQRRYPCEIHTLCETQTVSLQHQWQAWWPAGRLHQRRLMSY